MKIRRTIQGLLLAAALVLLGAASGSAQATIDQELQKVFAGLSAGGRAEVLVTFFGKSGSTAEDLSALRAAGIAGGVRFKHLPIVGTLATREQVDALAKSPRVRSVFHNRKLEYHNFDARQLSGVDRLRAEAAFTRRNGGMPVSGKGVGVVINDSGVDGTHPDLTLGKNLVQNVFAPLTRDDMAAAGFEAPVFVENVPNTDNGGTGHGTHVAGIVGGTGQASGGQHAGVAPGARLVGVGSGAAVLVLNSLAGFEYAMENQERYNIRVVTNSFGTSGGFNPDEPLTVASRILVEQRNIVVIFSAGNRGGIDTHSPFGKAPWNISVANALKNGTLAPSSSRGARQPNRTAKSSTGEVIAYVDEPTITAPGTNILSARATIAAGASTSNPYYVSLSGTSMSTPHVAGIVALLLEANPLLKPLQVQKILQETATKMPGYFGFEVGAGHVNAYAAVQKAFDLTTPFGATQRVPRNVAGERDVKIYDKTFDYTPASLPGAYKHPFTVQPGVGILTVDVTYDGLEVPVYGNADNPLLLDVYDPKGNRYNAFQLYFALFNLKRLTIVIVNPIPGTWTAEVKSITPSGQQAGNFLAFPDRVRETITTTYFDAPTSSDVPASHPASGAVNFALTNGFLQPCAAGKFCPGSSVTRAQLAQSFTQFGAVRQFLPLSGGSTFADVSAAQKPFAEAVAARGASLRDPQFRFGGVMEGNGTRFNPGGSVNRAQFAKMLVRAIGGDATATAHSGDVTVLYDGKRYVVADQDQIPVGLRGYAQAAINGNMLNVFWTVEQGPYDAQPTLKPYFKPAADLTRADAAVAITRFYSQYFR